jgi:hypothetical protein
LDERITAQVGRRAKLAMEQQDKAHLRLTDDQVEEVKRRLADPHPKFLTLEELRARFTRRRK